MLYWVERMATPAAPEVRASHLKDDLSALSALGPDVARRITARLPPGTLDLIGEATRLEWLPVELNARLAEAVHDEVGPDGTRAWGRTSAVLALDTPLLSGLVRGAVGLFGLSPAAYFKYAPLVWNAIYRGCGALAPKFDGPSRARIVAGPFPRTLTTVAYRTALAGSFEGAFTFCKVAGQVTIDDASVTSPTYLASWGA